MLMVARHFLRGGVRRDRGCDGGIVGLHQSRFGQTLLQAGFIPQPLRGIRAMAMTDPVVRASEIMEKHRRP